MGFELITAAEAEERRHDEGLSCAVACSYSPQTRIEKKLQRFLDNAKARGVENIFFFGIPGQGCMSPNPDERIAAYDEVMKAQGLVGGAKRRGRCDSSVQIVPSASIYVGDENKGDWAYVLWPERKLTKHDFIDTFKEMEELVAASRKSLPFLDCLASEGHTAVWVPCNGLRYVVGRQYPLGLPFPSKGYEVEGLAGRAKKGILGLSQGLDLEHVTYTAASLAPDEFISNLENCSLITDPSLETIDQRAERITARLTPAMELGLATAYDILTSSLMGLVPDKLAKTAFGSPYEHISKEARYSSVGRALYQASKIL